MTKLIYPELSYQVRGAVYDVYNELHHLQLSEQGWETALLIALRERGVVAERQVEYELRYKGYRVGRFFTDVLVEDKLLLELKVKDALEPIDEAQTLMYLKATGLRLGILINLGELRFKRLPNFIRERAPCPAPEADATDGGGLVKALREALEEVHAELGPGFMHMHYRRAARIELRLRDIAFDVRKEITLQYHGQTIETREAWLTIVEGQILLAPIAVKEITPALETRLRQYLRLLRLPSGLIANFYGTRLEAMPVYA